MALFFFHISLINIIMATCLIFCGIPIFPYFLKWEECSHILFHGKLLNFVLDLKLTVSYLGTSLFSSLLASNISINSCSTITYGFISYSSTLKNVMYLGIGILIIVNLLSSTYQIVLLKESVSFMNDFDYESACLLVQ